MPHVFPVEPRDGWAAGDLAYCVNARTREPCSPALERGRVYRVAAAEKPSNIGHHGLKLEGVDTGKAWGFWSNKFIKIGPVGGRLQRLAAATQYTMAHYWPGIASVDRSAKRCDRNGRSPKGESAVRP